MSAFDSATFATEEKGGVKEIFSFILSELKPRGKILTTFNVISAPIILLGALLIVYRLVEGLGAVTNLSQEFPWGIWIGFDVMVGVAFAGGAYVLTFAVYVLRADKYHSIIRATVLNGLLAYVFYAGAIFLDLGRWWNIANPLFGNEFGANSVLFLIAWHFLLYMLAEFVEFSPAIAEWLGMRKVRKFLGRLTVGAVVVGIALSTLHQAGLGALFMMAKDKIHPLWYTEFIPVLFFVSSIFAGLSMVIFEGTISHRVFSSQIGQEDHAAYDGIIIGLSKGCAVSLFVYFFAHLLIFIHGWHWSYIATPMGYWYLTEIVGLVAIPCVMFFQAVRSGNLLVIRIAAILTMIGIIVNRLNISIIAYKWWIPFSERYFPSWMEIVITLAIIFAEVWVFRWIVTRMPVFGKPPAWAEERH
ncbi:MAG: NrfD/PsrC family molybdoenzyme membrane anchor subunit [Smithellaceae bacterium]|nr:NrfD/PsrC family molybdoenzyme membrane anchor subunit [Smithellaceae bacterium]